jgi:hypothetical protein
MGGEAKKAAGMTVTKRREGDGRYGPMWRVLFDGEPTIFRITKSDPPRYGKTQMWDVIDGADEDVDFLFDAKSLEGAIAALEIVGRVAIRAAIAKAEAS